MKLIYVDMDDTLCEFKQAYLRHKQHFPEVIYPQSQIDFFRDLDPIAGAISSIHALENSEKYDVYILTAPSVRNPLCYMEKRIWVEKHLGFDFVNKLIISPNKSLLKGDYLIDDYANGKGQEGFEGELLHFGSEQFKSWQSVLQYLTP